jgi:DNA-binding HxlR family transcriptional regulator
VGKAYNQYCPVAYALDVVGERWSLLVVRELQHGPLRYTDLLGRLPGCSTNVLAARLKELERHDVVRREKLPPPAASTVYSLTECGRGLAPVLGSLAHWGMRMLGPPPPEALEPGWLEKALRTAVAPLVGTSVSVGFRIDDEEASIVGGMAVPGIPEDVAAVITADPLGLYDLFVHGSRHGVEIEGDPDAVERVLEAAGALAPVPG